MKKVKQIFKQNSRAGNNLHNNIQFEAKIGVPGWIRTNDPLLRRQPLYPLSYRDGFTLKFSTR